MKFWHCVCMLGGAIFLGACGGGDSSVTTLSGPGLNGGNGTGVVVGSPVLQSINNLPVTVDGGASGQFSLGQANVLFATVTICAPGSRARCTTIDHVQVDTGSVGLRIMASKVATVGLPKLNVSVDASSGKANDLYECYPFVTGGFWGRNAVADVGLGMKWANAVPIQVIDDDPASKIKAPLDCDNAVSGQVINSASTLGANGILGIGSVTLDCGLTCVQGNYSGSYVQYYSCPADASDVLQCVPAAVPANEQVFNPVAAFDTDNNGISITLPQLTGVGAAVVHGELIFGIDSAANNQVPSTAKRIALGVDWMSNPDSYLNITTLYKNQTIFNSYLDTGTNGIFFNDPSITRCKGSTWYCPTASESINAILTDGDTPRTGQVNVAIQMGNADSYFSTSNNAFPGLAGEYDKKVSSSFSWGLPLFYGRRVFLSIWMQKGAETGPWYAF